VDEMTRFFAWGAFLLGGLFFLMPLVGMTEFSLKMRRGEYSFDAYRKVFEDPQFWATFGYSLTLAAGDHRLWRAAGGADRLLGAAEAAAGPPGDRVHHPAAAGDPGHRDRLRLHPALQHLVGAAADRIGALAPISC
jgi:hypothetical protein